MIGRTFPENDLEDDEEDRCLRNDLGDRSPRKIEGLQTFFGHRRDVRKMVRKWRELANSAAYGANTANTSRHSPNSLLSDAFPF